MEYSSSQGWCRVRQDLKTEDYLPVSDSLARSCYPIEPESMKGRYRVQLVQYVSLGIRRGILPRCLG
jgi:hypothetical protein